MSRKTENARIDIYARITDRIVADLENGVRPWVKPWSARNMTGRVSRPLRHNGQAYTGLNVLLLWSESVARGFTSATWMTFRQANELGAHVRKGENGATVVYASRFTKTEADADGAEIERDIPFLKAYTVFNCDQIEGLPEHYYSAPDAISRPLERIEHADGFFDNTDAVVRYGGNKAYYSPSTDHIQLPEPAQFRDVASFIAIRAHETLHWTSSAHRLNRDLSRYHKDRRERAFEEMLVELGAAMICADLGIVPELEPRPDHAAYIQTWAAILGSDKRAIFQAAAHAQRAVAYLHGLQPQVGSDQETAA
ncbi:zincin-like metallopeptidase domain-containing protein (plasmid) [Aliirhizobium terrae]|uniref:ArdC family protein n=1 Tax=Terrirhizobium terrae TaxID=2926709 RepID=UPI002577D6EF|nr:zincin-like metallopeptidase domain-containing protein [Rhizobium sp. CC-CFT758]WJH38579.1 zincin-like metallopeptidase domain-containing protein [Rhizobium sp. CC-CFT758]